MLMRRWERARQGQGQLVLIVGEPGLGKSRLIDEFHARLSDTPHTWVEWSCSQLLQNTPLHPIAEWGRQRFGGGDTPAERRLADLESSLAQVKLDPVENASMLAPLLDIPLPKERASTLAPEELRRRQLAALTNWVMAGARVQPVVLAFEDLHWADPTTLDVLRGIAERGAQVPLYIVATTRPEFRPPWGMRSHHGTISLAPLDRGQVRDMVAELSARHALSRDVVDDVAARTGGVPLFVEEVTRLLLERGEQGGAQAIPPTPQQSLMARLDRLGPAREVAQIGSVIGRGFSYKLLKAVAGMDNAPLEAALERLSDADIVLVDGVLPESDYRFKHALIQDAAYENLLKSRRQLLHRRIAETLRDRFAHKAAAEPELLAHHFTQAGLTDAAIEWWGKAGDHRKTDHSFLSEAQRRMSEWNALLDQVENTKRSPLRPQMVIRAVSDLLPDDAVISLDCGANTHFAARCLKLRANQRLTGTGMLASMAPGLSYGIAAKYAFPDRPSIVIAGDGGFSMLMAELVTAVSNKLPVKIILLKNNSLAEVKFEQEDIGNPEFGCALAPIDFVAFAKACGADAYRCERPEEVVPAIKGALESRGTALVEAIVEPNERPTKPGQLKA